MAAPDLPPFDTRQSAAELREHGFSQEQADAIVGADVHATAHLATKADLAAVKVDLEKAIAHQTVEFHKAINSQTWRMAAMFGAMLGLLRWLFPVS